MNGIDSDDSDEDISNLKKETVVTQSLKDVTKSNEDVKIEET
jgi:hypothetical protein